MNNYQKKSMTAIDIYQNGYQSSFFGGKNKKDSKRFFVELRNAVIHESKTAGACELIDKILEQGRGKLDVIAYAALADISNGFESNELVDVENDLRYKEYVPHVTNFNTRRKLRWSECESHRVYISIEEVLDVVYNVRKVLRMYQLHNKGVEEKTAASTENNKEKKGEETVGNAKEQAEIIIAAAKDEADKITKEANAEAEKIIEDAQEKAKAIDDSVNEQVSIAAKVKAEKLISRVDSR